MKRILLCMTIGTLFAVRAASGADLTNVRSLYASASYDEALAELNKVDADSWTEQVDEYRALCLVASAARRKPSGHSNTSCVSIPCTR